MSDIDEIIPAAAPPDDEDKKDETVVNTQPSPRFSDDQLSVQPYRLYKRRFAGLVGLCLLNIVAGMSWPWFGPIANNMVTDFGVSLDQVTWLGNLVALVYLPVSLAIPPFVKRFGLRRSFDVGAVCLVLSSWIRYAGTVKTLSVNGSYALLVVGQIFAAIAQPIYQVLCPKYSETWFDLKGRTTATAILAISNPIGGALGQLLSPVVGDTRQSILILGIMCTAIAPCVFLVGNAPPTPPTYAGSKESPSLVSLLRDWFGVEKASSMALRERFDFGIVVLVFGVVGAATNTFSIFTAQIFQPVGYSADTSGFFGACLLLSGIVGAVATGPLFDRVLTHHLALTSKILVPILAILWLSFIWAVKPDNTGGIYAIMAILGVCSLIMLPVGLELGCELTRNADGSASILWFMVNLVGFVFALAEAALRAGPDANPPLNMKRALIFNGAFVMSVSASIFLLHGKQIRKEVDEQKLEESIQRLGPTTADANV